MSLNGYTPSDFKLVWMLQKYTYIFRGVLYIPRIYNTPPKNFSPTMTRIQFPIKLAFAITSNKSQGQSLESIGIYLNTGEFKAH